jgi:TetR/AcrR family transcriptional regulator, cholesterol catabolism regulator
MPKKTANPDLRKAELTDGDTPSVGPVRDGTARRPRKRDQELLRVATEVFWRSGYPASTIQQVADAMGVLKGSLYYYIESKEDLLFWIFNECHADAAKLMEQIGSLDESPTTRLELFMEQFVAFYLTNVERVTLYFRQWRYLTGERLETLMKQRDEYEEFIIGLIREGQAAGEIPSNISAKYTAFFILGAVNGIPDWYRREGHDSVRKISSAYASLAIRILTEGDPSQLGRGDMASPSV